MFKERHVAQCSNCGNVHTVRKSGAFINHFCLPDMCSGCGKGMNERGGDELPHWLHVITKSELQKPTKNRNPLTWLRLSRWVEIERHEMHAR